MANKIWSNGSTETRTLYLEDAEMKARIIALPGLVPVPSRGSVTASRLASASARTTKNAPAPQVVTATYRDKRGKEFAWQIRLPVALLPEVEKILTDTH